MCGGYRQGLPFCTAQRSYSPRVRGLSAFYRIIHFVILVFPPCAGVIGSESDSKSVMASIPPVCGGYRNQYALMLKNGRYSPRVRGLSVVLSTVTRWLEVFPPCAGVIGGVVHGYPLAGSIPPVCGGYRSCCPRLPAGWKYSPRMRGLSGTLTDTFCTVLVFPPHAGVIGYFLAVGKTLLRIPPACGGYRRKRQPS